MSPLPRRVWILGWVSLFADVASEMVYPIIPIFIHQVLKAPVSAIGAIEGIAEGLVSFMKGWSGWHSDALGRRTPYIRWGYALSAVGKPLLALAHVPWVVLVGRGVDRFGKGLRTTARDALIADSVESQDYGRAFGLHRSMDTAGAFLGGVVLLGLLATWVTDAAGLRLVFLIAILPGAISVLLTFALKEEPAPARVEPGPRPSYWSTLREMPAPYWRALTVTLTFAFAIPAMLFFSSGPTSYLGRRFLRSGPASGLPS